MLSFCVHCEYLLEPNEDVPDEVQALEGNSYLMSVFCKLRSVFDTKGVFLKCADTQQTQLLRA